MSDRAPLTDADLVAIRARANETPPCVHSADTLRLLDELRGRPSLEQIEAAAVEAIERIRETTRRLLEREKAERSRK